VGSRRSAAGVGGRGGDGIRRRSGGRGGEARGPDPDARRATGDGRSGMLQCVRVIAGHMGLQAHLLTPTGLGRLIC
jgi:hypothetical protein